MEQLLNNFKSGHLKMFIVIAIAIFVGFWIGKGTRKKIVELPADTTKKEVNADEKKTASDTKEKVEVKEETTN